jgi:dolichol-phosphate mannosyltransferase
MRLSVVIPANNEEGSIAGTLRSLYSELTASEVEHEIIVVNDNSRDHTEAILRELMDEVPTLRYLNNPPPNGFGLAVRRGLRTFSGEAVAVYMADGSDDPRDLVRFFNTLQTKNVDCVFGTRFSRESRVIAYPHLKWVLNRLANAFISVLFGLRYNDVTNAFKLYRRHVIDGLHPILSHHFNLTVELPLKAIVRGYSYAVVPNHWTNRKEGESKLKIKEMGSRYMFIILYCFIEKWLSRGDYRRHSQPGTSSVEEDVVPTNLTVQAAGRSEGAMKRRSARPEESRSPR